MVLPMRNEAMMQVIDMITGCVCYETKDNMR